MPQQFSDNTVIVFAKLWMERLDSIARKIDD
jgi:hypothetical protein